MMESASTGSPLAEVARFRRRYLVALVSLGLCACFGQWLSQQALSRKGTDSRVINLAGRQRMLSQRLVKCLLALATVTTPAARANCMSELETSKSEWLAAHAGLLDGSPELGLPRENEPSFRERMQQLSPMRDRVLALGEQLVRSTDRETAVVALLAAASDYLVAMDRQVLALEQRSQERLRFVEMLEVLLFVLSLGALVGQALLVFRPALSRLRRSIGDHDRATQSLVAAERRHSAVLRVLPDGLFTMAADGRFRSVRHGARRKPRRVDKLLKSGSARQLGAAVAAVLPNDKTVAVVELVPERGEYRFEGRVVAYEADEALVVVRNVTEQRRLESLWVEAVDEERKRMGKEIHDGVCQSLAGALMLARRLVEQTEQNELGAPLVESLQEALTETRELGRGQLAVRLRDTGSLGAALVGLGHAVARAHGVEVVVDCDVEDSGEVGDGLATPGCVDNHFYRIAQEAVSNAVRHASPERVHVRLVRRDGQLALTVFDDGVGFDANRVDGNGLGLRSIEMRARALGAVCELQSTPGEGTRLQVRLG